MAAAQAKETATIVKWGLPIFKISAKPFDKVEEAQAARALRNITEEEIKRRYVLSAAGATVTASVTAALLWADAAFGWFALTLPSNVVAVALWNSARRGV
mmetsp:Transcript_69368/g.115292  ORF Transcript_69368/g.115292 Transcript_69368/m.115292 type:complete len:100 (-) Transcript_69368:344-643(-)|eukprot:CAMPEP_0119308988 /NCGR_PEP_ID=MMETSP1333-20130426/13411_1 /TAXON_ID=418940 /ORGANISM="Scyphosphaera apsteinii, Strain RCC1455" /LENGTH=99 /DNA_ID=CAMNT_0007312887 /DNA_START=40 /DNA_END=339 /DNA_ORIENTATION=+